MIVAAALVPQAPLLLPGLSGRGHPVASVGSAAARVVAELVEAAPDEIVLVASGDVTSTPPVRGDLGLHRWGVGRGTPTRPSADGAPHPVPLPFAVGATLLASAGWQGPCRWEQVGWSDAGTAAAGVGSRLAAGTDRTGLLVLGDGGARRTVKAPGHLDERAAAFDDSLVDALTTQPARLVDVDAAVAAELMVSGLPAWQALAGALGAPTSSGEATTSRRTVDLRSVADPFGVLYVVGWVGPG